MWPYWPHLSKILLGVQHFSCCHIGHILTVFESRQLILATVELFLIFSSKPLLSLKHPAVKTRTTCWRWLPLVNLCRAQYCTSRVLSPFTWSYASPVPTNTFPFAMRWVENTQGSNGSSAAGSQQHRQIAQVGRTACPSRRHVPSKHHIFNHLEWTFDRCLCQ